MKLMPNIKTKLARLITDILTWVYV